MLLLSMEGISHYLMVALVSSSLSLSSCCLRAFEASLMVFVLLFHWLCLCNRFFVEERRIGIGGYGTVFLCRHFLNNLELGNNDLACFSFQPLLERIIDSRVFYLCLFHPFIPAASASFFPRFYLSIFFSHGEYVSVLVGLFLNS